MIILNQQFMSNLQGGWTWKWNQQLQLDFITKQDLLFIH
jgi:hypothetical protein